MSGSDRSKTRLSADCTTPSSTGAAASLCSDPKQTPTSLYLHSPFCIRRCAYCDFATSTLQESLVAPYLAKLEAEWQRAPLPVHLETLYFGGGTPTALPVAQFRSVLEMVQARLDGPPLEFTCEANPESLTQEHVAAMREFGVHRVSLGAQSFQTDVLAALGREHAPKHTYRAVELLRSAGLENLSLDLIYATPGETRQQVQADLEVLVKLQVPHVSAYCLTYEPGTPLTRLLDQGRVEKSDSEEELFQGRLVRDTLQSHGLVQYEISNYARPGLESLHNNVYWRGEEYFGIGLGAGSYEHGVRRTNTRNQEEYLAPWADPQRPPHLAEELDPEARAREVVILGLRRTRGLDLDRLARQTGFALFDLYSEELLDKLLHLNVLLLDAGNLRLTPRGLELADSIFVDLV